VRTSNKVIIIRGWVGGQLARIALAARTLITGGISRTSPRARGASSASRLCTLFPSCPALTAFPPHAVQAVQRLVLRPPPPTKPSQEHPAIPEQPAAKWHLHDLRVSTHSTTAPALLLPPERDRPFPYLTETTTLLPRNCWLIGLIEAHFCHQLPRGRRAGNLTVPFHCCLISIYVCQQPSFLSKLDSFLPSRTVFHIRKFPSSLQARRHNVFESDLVCLLAGCLWPNNP